jgi:hypothetical protein
MLDVVCKRDFVIRLTFFFPLYFPLFVGFLLLQTSVLSRTSANGVNDGLSAFRVITGLLQSLFSVAPENAAPDESDLRFLFSLQKLIGNSMDFPMASNGPEVLCVLNAAKAMVNSANVNMKACLPTRAQDSRPASSRDSATCIICSEIASDFFNVYIRNLSTAASIPGSTSTQLDIALASLTVCVLCAISWSHEHTSRRFIE